MRPHHLRSVELFTPRFEDSTKFFTEALGLSVVQGSSDAVYLTGGHDRFTVALHRRQSRGIRKIWFEMASADDVEATAKTLVDRQVEMVDGPGPLARGQGEGTGVSFVDPEGRVVQLSADDFAPTSRNADDWEPEQLSHVVCNTANIEGIVQFYEQTLGMPCSDRSADQMAFLRAGSEHHSLAFNRAEWPSLNHLSFRVKGIEEVMRGLGALRAAGTDVLWGPGKHGVGNHVFCYFREPSGYVVELTAEDLTIDEDTWVPTVHPRSPEMMDRWGTAGFPTTDAREAMAGEPDRGHASLSPFPA